MIRFEIPFPPPSLKNRQQIRRKGRGRGARPFIAASDEAEDARKAIRLLASRAVSGNAIVYPTRDVHVTMTYFARDEICIVEVAPGDERPRGFAGRKRDLHNMPDVVCDAMEGSVYTNDNQITRLILTREL